MKQILITILGALALGTATAQPNVGVSISINQPGVYGRINIGDLPRPALVLPQPVIISAPSYRVERSPIYLYVPVVHQQNWRRHCGSYNACGQPVYFVRDQWVRERYEQQHPGWNRGRHRGWDRNDNRGDDDRGRGHGRDRRDRDDRDDRKHGRDRRD